MGDHSSLLVFFFSFLINDDTTAMSNMNSFAFALLWFHQLLSFTVCLRSKNEMKESKIVLPKLCFPPPPDFHFLRNFVPFLFSSCLLSCVPATAFRFVGDWTIHSPHQNFWRTNLEETTLRSGFQRRFLWTFRCVSLGHDRRMQTDKNGKEEQKRKGKDDLSPPSPAQRNKEEREQHTYGP